MDGEFDYDQYDHETTLMVSEAEKHCAETEAAFIEHKTLTRNAKAEYETAVVNLRSLIKQRQQERGPGKRQGQFNFDSARQERESNAPPVPDESWRQVPITAFEKHGLSKSIVGILQKNGINTIGDMADFTQPNAQGYGKTLSDIKGLGDSKIQQINDADTAFWAEWNARGNESTTGNRSESDGDVNTSEKTTADEPGAIPITITTDEDDDDDGVEEDEIDEE